MKSADDQEVYLDEVGDLDDKSVVGNGVACSGIRELDSVISGLISLCFCSDDDVHELIIVANNNKLETKVNCRLCTIIHSPYLSIMRIDIRRSVIVALFSFKQNKKLLSYDNSSLKSTVCNMVPVRGLEPPRFPSRF